MSVEWLKIQQTVLVLTFVFVNGQSKNSLEYLKNEMAQKENSFKYSAFKNDWENSLYFNNFYNLVRETQ